MLSAGFLITLITLSGCGVAKNLEKPRSKPAPTPENHSGVWFRHHFSEDTAKAVKISAVALCYGLFYDERLV